MCAAGAQDCPVGTQDFPRSHRLLQRADFDRVFKKGKRRTRTPEFILISIANDYGHPRLGVAIGKRHARRAVDRNRFKRVVRESFRLARGNLASHDIVIVPGRGVARLDSRVLFESLERAWKKLDSTLTAPSPD